MTNTGTSKVTEILAGDQSGQRQEDLKTFDIEHKEDWADSGPSHHPDHAEKLTFRTLVAILALGFFWNVALGSFTVPVSVISDINDELGPSSVYSWMGSAWPIATGIAYLVSGTISDLVGRRWFIVGGAVIQAIGGLVGALAKNVPTVIAAMTLLGLGEGGGALVIPAISELLPTKYRGLAVGVLALSSQFWVMCSSLIGHAMLVQTRPGFRSIFWMVLAMNGSAAVMIFFTYFPALPLSSHGAPIKKRELLYNFDYVGLACILSGPTLVLLGITWISAYGSSSAHFIAPFTIGIIICIFLGFHQVYIAKNPVLHPYLFKKVRTFTMLLIIALVGGMLFYSLQAFFPIYLGSVFDTDPVRVGVDSMPNGALTNFGGSICCILLPWLGPKIGTTALVVIPVALQLIFIPLMYLPTPNNREMALAFSALAGFGIGAVENITILLVQLTVPPELIGFASGVLGIFRQFGGSAGTAIYATIFSSKIATLLPERVASAATGAGLPPSSVPQLLGILSGLTSGTISSVPGINEDIIGISILAMKNAYISAFRYVWLASIPFGVIALACSLSLKDLSPMLTLETIQHLKNETVESDVEKSRNVAEGEQ